jgi:hypothetical protein
VRAAAGGASAAAVGPLLRVLPGVQQQSAGDKCSVAAARSRLAHMPACVPLLPLVQRDGGEAP